MLIFEDCGGFDPDVTFASGQCFRWKQENDGWHGVAEGRCVTVLRRQDALIVTGAAEIDRQFWKNYLALDLDYSALLERFCRRSRRLAACVEAAPGLRVLRQPFFETLITFIISQNNNIPRIRGIVERLCQCCGAPLENGQYAFPSPDQLAARTSESLEILRAGWRVEYILDAARRVAEGSLCEEQLRAMPFEEARARLMTVRGVGPKVADCTLLYGLGCWQAAPMDVWMKRAMRTLFPRGFPRCCRGWEGIAQQYIFEYARRHPLDK